MNKASAMRWPLWLTRVAIVAGLLAAWQLAAHFGDPLFVSPPTRVVAALQDVLGNPQIDSALITLMIEVLTAFVIAVVLGVAVGVALGLSRVARSAFMPVLLLLYGTPQITILPVIMLAFGIGPVSKIVFGLTHGFFPVALTAAASIRNIKPVLEQSARSMGASPWQRLRYVLLPHMVPSLLTGLRLGMTAVLLGVLLAELYASTNGVGQFTRSFTESFNPAKLFALIGVIAVIAIIPNELLRRAERRFSKWRDG